MFLIRVFIPRPLKENKPIILRLHTRTFVYPYLNIFSFSMNPGIPNIKFKCGTQYIIIEQYV